MKASLLTSLAASLVLGLLAAPAAQAAIIVTLPTYFGYDPNLDEHSWGNGSFVVTQDISFTITTDGTAGYLVFDEWVTSDGNNTNSIFRFSPNLLSYSLNGGPTTTTGISSLVDNRAITVGDLTPNDGYLPLSSVVVAVNDVFTLKAATYTLSVSSSNAPNAFNPQANQTFTGSAFLMTIAGARLSANTSAVGAVPEPSRALLLLGGLGALLLRRRRRE